MQSLLQQYFGFDHFRAGQEQVITAITSGRSAAAIFPTGSGKSLCYQLPALILPHLTIVVSPLLALIQDQLAFLQTKGIPAASIDSTQSREQSQAVMSGVRQGKIKILMISVERFNNERFREFISSIPISLLVIDEAHCISEWGHNFRPDYLKLPQYVKELSIPQVLLLTATATAKVIQDMGAKFTIAPADIAVTGFYRPNLNLHVQGVKAQDKLTALVDWLRKRDGHHGIIYVTLQQSAEEVAKALSRQGLNALAYHAGMDSDKRQQVQKAFMSGRCPIIVATIAFGMGVDKQDIRFVVHFDLPKSIENYAQEIGRAGRDGQVAECLVLANTDNLNVLQNFVYGDTPDRRGIAYVLNDIATASRTSHKWEVVLNHLSAQSNVRLLSLKTLLVYLEMLNIIKPSFSYYAEYRFKLLCSESELVTRFTGERQRFVQALLNSSQKAKIWYSIDFDSLNSCYPSDRRRVISAINYFEEKGLIELQTKQITEVYQLLKLNENIDETVDMLANKFLIKERSEIARIQAMVDLLASNTCLTRRLSEYFADTQVPEQCGHCSVCTKGGAILPSSSKLTPLSQLDFSSLCHDLIIPLKGTHMADANMLARALCGLTTPLFTQLKMRRVHSFAALEAYPFAEVRLWCEQHVEASL
ncbi:RecQ family ATP-dependent DNA helicase [Shewanella psychrotolerans]|uniref:RecQ family ATP-dependent DNA helicase n=1 Tax=Shewanella psychrotolerans TaxID=2864206 RepID=UPI001C65E4C1|nr:ATP-dependent DNA helicase RecQ [Shewanella psychrotolerans]QYJ99802.1 RecQ family ATP-dependent DNA helicase [Shewanella psychrotolerans]